MTLLVRNGVYAFVLGVVLSACHDKKPDFEAEAERLKAYIVSEAPKETTKLDVDFDGKVRLIGYELSPQKPVKPGQRVTLTLYWQSTKPVEQGYRLFTHVLDGSGERIETLDDEGPLREPREGRPALPPEAWQAGKVYVDELRFKVPKSVKTEKIDVVAGISKKDQRLNVVAGEKDGEGAAKVVSIAVSVPPPEKPRMTRVEAGKLPAKAKIAVDGKLDEDAWKSATPLELGDPHAAKGTPKIDVKGTVKLLWSDAGFYAGYEIVDANVTSELDGKQKEETRFTKDDAVEMLLDPSRNDNKDYYEIQISPANGVFDTRFDRFKDPVVKGGAWGHQDWSSHLKSAVTVKGTLGKSGEKGTDKDEGYVVEVFVPWKSLSVNDDRNPPELGDIWRMNFHAVEDEGAVAWSPVNGVSFHHVQNYGYVTWADTKPEVASAEPAKADAKTAAASAAAGAGGKSAKADAPKPEKVAEKSAAPKPAAAAPAPAPAASN
ncbi:MAG: carbohydrate-binding family 9-like protein [Myxococcota bacterium]|nr:carbohydrate-binding family 9-like protein [Myxococcota bacterium]